MGNWDELGEALTSVGTSLRTGSAVLISRGGRWIAADWRFHGSIAAGAGYVAVYEAAAHPHGAVLAVPAAAVAWAGAALTLAPPAAEQPDDEQLVDDEPEETPREAFAKWLLELIGDRPGIHLRELYPAMRTLPSREQHDDPTLRAALDTLGVPVRRSLRVGSVAGRSGVHRDDVLPLAPPPGERPVEPGGDAGQGADSPAGEYVESGVESA